MDVYGEICFGDSQPQTHTITVLRRFYQAGCHKQTLQGVLYLLARIVVPTSRPPRLLVEIGIAKRANPSLRGWDEQVAFKCSCAVGVDAGNFFRSDNDRDHDSLKQGVAHD